MSVSFLDVFLISLATLQVVEVWRHSELTRELRCLVDMSVTHLFRSVMMCNWCLSVWVASIIAVIWLCHIPYLLYLDQVLIVGLATSRLANLTNDVLYDWCRTPKYDQEPPPEKSDVEDIGDHSVPNGANLYARNHDPGYQSKYGNYGRVVCYDIASPFPIVMGSNDPPTNILPVFSLPPDSYKELFDAAQQDAKEKETTISSTGTGPGRC